LFQRGTGVGKVILGLGTSFILGLLVGAGVFSHLLHLEGAGGRIWSVENVRETSVPIAAVRSDGAGMICQLTVRIFPGEGRVLVDTSPLVGFDFQYANITALKVACDITGIARDEDGEGIKGADVLFIVCTPTGERVEVQAIDGPSAGAITAIALIAAIENRKVRRDVVLTGTIQEDGTIGPVGGILSKAQAAEEIGAGLFLVPPGQSKVVTYRQVTYQPFPGFQWVTWEPVVVDLNEYAENHGWAIRIEEVSNIEEVMEKILE